MMVRALCFTVDLDRDVNICIDGQLAAGSIDRGSGISPRFASTEKGLALLSDLLDDLGIKATYFAEARTLENIECANYLEGHEIGMHGLDHEDLTGCNDAILSVEMINALLERASNIITDVVGERPRCFRAPYMKIDDVVLEIISSLGIKYDSSTYAHICTSKFSHSLNGDIVEVSVPEDLDRNGNKISAYLWPMHEGKRKPQDYLDMASKVDEGIFTLATHTWHMCESRKSGPMDRINMSKNVANVGMILEKLLDGGFEPMIIPDAAERFSCQQSRANIYKTM